MGNRDNCDLHIPFKQWPRPDLNTLAREIGEDMKVIERWAQYFRKNCGSTPCEAAGSAQNTGQEVLNAVGDTLVTIVGTKIHECGLTVGATAITVATAGIYHITGHCVFDGFVGGVAPTVLSELLISTTPGNDSLRSQALGYHAGGHVRGSLEVSADIYCPAGATIVLLFNNHTGGTATIEVQLDAHLVHCDCEGTIFGGCA